MTVSFLTPHPVLRTDTCLARKSAPLPQALTPLPPTITFPPPPPPRTLRSAPDPEWCFLAAAAEEYVTDAGRWLEGYAAGFRSVPALRTVNSSPPPNGVIATQCHFASPRTLVHSPPPSIFLWQARRRKVYQVKTGPGPSPSATPTSRTAAPMPPPSPLPAGGSSSLLERQKGQLGRNCSPFAGFFFERESRFPHLSGLATAFLNSCWQTGTNFCDIRRRCQHTVLQNAQKNVNRKYVNCRHCNCSLYRGVVPIAHRSSPGCCVIGWVTPDAF